MKICSLLIATMAMVMLWSCGSKADKKLVDEQTETESAYKAINDSTIYGLACEGCTDSMLVILPGDCSDPIEFDIIAANKMHRVHGKPEIGDKIAILINPANKKEALFVVNIDQLKGAWVNEVMPSLRSSAANPKADKSLSDAEKAEMDSLIKRLMVPHECGFNLKQDFSAMPIGIVWQRNSLEQESPVEYPEVKRYTEWHIFNGHLVLTETSSVLGKDQKLKQSKAHNDTADIVLLGRDTLVLRINNVEKSYYRQQQKDEKK